MRGSTKAPRGRSKSSGRWLREHFSDPFVQRAQREGWRSRAVFKLEEIDRRERLFAGAHMCLDLGAAPGAWSQYAARRMGAAGKVLASDILPMPELPGVEFLQADLREARQLERLIARLPPQGVDVVLSDMAPNLSGVASIDQPRSLELAQGALELALRVLKPGGSALIKVFEGAGLEELVASARGHFGTVKRVKPGASRSRSPETYLLARQFGLV